jgi:RNA polymerase sigma-70 factor (ECF subfamily)
VLLEVIRAIVSRRDRKPASTQFQSREQPPEALAHYEVFWQVWLSHREHLLRLGLQWMRGNRADAEDVLSQTKIKAALRFGTSPLALRDPKAWLSRLLYNVCMDVYRRRAYMEETGNLALEEGAGEVHLAHPQPSPEKFLLDHEAFRAVRRGLDELPPEWRRALIERCIHCRSYQEIAEEAATTQANIRKRVQLARAFLRGCLSCDGG